MNGKRDVELLCEQQKPTTSPIPVKPADIPEGFKPDEGHHVWVVKKFGKGGQGAVYLADISSSPQARSPSPKSMKPLHAVKLIHNKKVVERGKQPVEVRVHLLFN